MRINDYERDIYDIYHFSNQYIIMYILYIFNKNIIKGSLINSIIDYYIIFLNYD